MEEVVIKRLSRRVEFATDSEVSIKGARHNATLVNISLRGALVAFDTTVTVEPGIACEVAVYLNRSFLKLPFDGEFVHARDNLAGIRFIRMDLTAMTHLRRLLELNTGDAEQVRIELDSFIHSRMS